MDENEHKALCDELETLVGQGPGENEVLLRRVREIVLAYEADPGSSNYAREKAHEVLGGFVMWYSARKWKKYPDFESRLITSIRELRSSAQKP